MNPIAIAIKGKGIFNFSHRAVSIIRRYGLTTGKMEQELAEFFKVLRRFQCSASFPITSVALLRNPETIKKYYDQGIEFAIHGYRHVDHSQLSQQDQQDQLKLAQQVFKQAGIQPRGFRGPYLRWNRETLTVLQQLGLAYDSSQGLAWDVADDYDAPAYEHVLEFYGALPANHYPSLPSL